MSSSEFSLVPWEATTFFRQNLRTVGSYPKFPAKIQRLKFSPLIRRMVFKKKTYFKLKFRIKIFGAADSKIQNGEWFSRKSNISGWNLASWGFYGSWF